MADTKPSLDFIAPLRIAFAIDGVELEISPITVGELPELLGIVEPIFGEMLVLVDEAMLGRLERGEMLPEDLAALVALVTNCGDRVLHAVALAARQPLAWVHGLLLDRLVELLVLLLRVNADFFGRAMPGIKARCAALPLPRSTGPTPSSSSSRTATATPTSAATRSASSAPTSSAADGASAASSAG